MLTSSRPLTVLDYYRVPYQISSEQPPLPTSGERAVLGSLLSADGSRAALYWPDLSEDAPASNQALQPRVIRFGSLTLAARVLSTDVLLGHLDASGSGSGWRAAGPLPIPEANLSQRSAGMNAAASLSPSTPTKSCGPSGPRDTERTTPAACGSGPWRCAAITGCVRLPRRLQIALRRAYAPIQARSRFPAWPLEESLHGFYDTVLGWVAEVAGVPVPWIAPWPRGYAWALVLTHDVETAEGLSLMPVLAKVEERRGYVSSWNFVPKRYEVPDNVLVGFGEPRLRGRDPRVVSRRARSGVRPHVAGAPARNGPLCPTVGGWRLSITRHPARLGFDCCLAV